MFEGMGKQKEANDAAPPRRKTFSDLPWMGSTSQQRFTGCMHFEYTWLHMRSRFVLCVDDMKCVIFYKVMGYTYNSEFTCQKQLNAL